MTRVAVVGAGMVGATTAARIAEARLCDHVALIDVAGDLARAMALDIGSSLPLLGSDTTLTGGESYDGARGADVVVITAGRPRQPGQSRSDLLEGNGRIVAEVCREVRSAAPDSVVIVVTNPLDEMTTLAQDALGFPPERVVGMAGLLDTARFRHFLAERAGAPASTVQALTLGSHGDTMVPLSRTATIGGRPAAEVLGAAVLEEVVQRTRDGGAEVVRLLQRGSAYWAPSAAVMLMVRAILRDEQVVLPIAARLSGQFGIDGVYVGVPGAARAARACRRSSRPGSTTPRSRRCAPRRRRCAAGWRICTGSGSCARAASAGALGRLAHARRRRSSTPCAARCSRYPMRPDLPVFPIPVVRWNDCEDGCNVSGGRRLVAAFAALVCGAGTLLFAPRWRPTRRCPCSPCSPWLLSAGVAWHACSRRAATHPTAAPTGDPVDRRERRSPRRTVGPLSIPLAPIGASLEPPRELSEPFGALARLVRESAPRVR